MRGINPNLLERLRGKVDLAELDRDGALVLHFNDDGDKRTMTVSPDLYGDLNMWESEPPYVVYTTYPNGEPRTFVVAELFEHELPQFLNYWGASSKEWLEPIRNGERFYGGGHVNKLVLMRRIK